MPMYSYRLQVFHAGHDRQLLACRPGGSTSVSRRSAITCTPWRRSWASRSLARGQTRPPDRCRPDRAALCRASAGLAHDTQRALRELQGLQRGTLRLGASSTPGIYLLPPVLAAFVQRYPGMTLALEIANSQRGRRRPGAAVGPRHDRHSPGASRPPHATLLAGYPVVIVPPHHRLATQPAVTLADLAGETWIFREAAWPPARWSKTC